MEKLRKIFVASVMFITVLSMSAIVAPAHAAAKAGDLIKMNGLSSVYYLGADGKRYVFPNEETYFSWYSDFSGVTTISQSELESYPLGANVTIRPGTDLVKITTDPKVYAVTPGGKLVYIASEAAAKALYGDNWAKRVVDVPDAFFTNYTTTGTSLDGTSYPEGSLIKSATSPDVYYIDVNGKARKIDNEAAFLANRFSFDNVITTTLAIPAAGTDITGAESALTDTSSGAGGVPSAGTGLTVSLASDTPASQSFVRSSANSLVAQANATFAKFNFTASNDGDVTVTTVKLTRSGLSADTDLANVYLYDGNTLLAEDTSIASKVVTFTDASGLFTVSKGTTREITVKADIAGGTTTISGIILGINAASDVVTNGATVSGSFPMNGNQMSVGTATDLGYATISNYTTYPATMDPGKTGQELWRFNVQASNQDMLLQYIKLTVVGTVANGDLANFYLADTSGTKIGSTVASMNSNNEVIFDLTASPYKITSGQTKTIVVYGDVVNGSGRDFKFTIRKASDFLVEDNNYGVNTLPLVNSGSGAAAFSLIDADASGNGTSINNGNVTVSLASDSPSGFITAGATGISLAKWIITANGEDVKVNTLRVTVAESAGTDIENGKLYFNGSQVGSTDTTVTHSAVNAFTVNQIIPAGQTATVEYKADMVNASNGNALPANDTVQATLDSSSSGDATGQSSLANVNITSSQARLMTIATGLMTASKNLAMADYTSSLPTGVKGSTNTKVGSFVLTAGTGEPVTVTQIQLENANSFGGNFQNLKIMNGSTQLATTQGTLSNASGAIYTFSLSPAVHIAAGQQYVVDVYADILTGATGFTGSGASGLTFYGASATGDITGGSANPSQQPALQTLVIASNGALAIAVDPSSPISQMLVMGTTGQNVATFKLSETSAAEDLTISALTIKDTTTATGSVSNIVITDGTTTYGSAASLGADGTVNITLATPITVPAGSSKTIIVNANVNAYPNATSASTHVFSISAVTGQGAVSGTSVSGSSSGTAGTMTLVKTKLTLAKANVTLSPARGVDTPVAEFTLANTANVANQSGTLRDMAVNISLSGGTWSTTSKAVDLYLNSINAANLIGSAANLGSVAEGGWSNGDNSPTSSIKDIVVAPGSTATIIVAADTTGAPTGAGVYGAISVTIPATSGVTWDDGVTNTLSTMDTLPISASMSNI